jgi:hypothetical protein
VAKGQLVQSSPVSPTDARLSPAQSRVLQAIVRAHANGSRFYIYRRTWGGGPPRLSGHNADHRTIAKLIQFGAIQIIEQPNAAAYYDRRYAIPAGQNWKCEALSREQKELHWKQYIEPYNAAVARAEHAFHCAKINAHSFATQLANQVVDEITLPITAEWVWEHVQPNVVALRETYAAMLQARDALKDATASYVAPTTDEVKALVVTELMGGKSE